jgi:hypothetical protein
MNRMNGAAGIYSFRLQVRVIRVVEAIVVRLTVWLAIRTL